VCIGNVEHMACNLLCGAGSCASKVGQCGRAWLSM
jgi:hypothetical protein